MLIKMSWRNIWRNRRRTLITAVSVAFGVLLSVTFTATGDYSYTNIINSGALLGPGHVTVEREGYNENPSISKRVKGAGRIRAIALKTRGVRDAVVRISGRAVFSSAARSTGGVFTAIDPEVESEKTNFYLKAIKEGGLFKDAMDHRAVIGSKMAERLRLGVGKKFIYTVTDINGDIVSEAVRVSGIFSTGVSETDSSVVLLPIGSVRKTLGYGPDEASLVALFINDQRRAGEIRGLMASRDLGSGLEVMTWRRTQVEMAGMVAIDRGMNYIFQFLIGILIAAGILNTVLMGVLERRREFGIMLALGISPKRLVGLVLLESLWIALAGLIIGAVITAPWYAYMSTTGINFAGMEGANIGMVPIDPVIKFSLYGTSAVSIISGIFILTLLAGLYPAFKASRIRPVESIKYS